MLVGLRRLFIALILAFGSTACQTTHPPPPAANFQHVEGTPCGQGQPLKVHFFDVGQALSVLVELPDSQTILVDLGDTPTRAGCGGACAAAHEHLLSKLAELLPGQAVSMVWITHQHSDHLGGAKGVFRQIRSTYLVDNGTDANATQVRTLHQAAQAAGAVYSIVAPGQTDIPLSVSPPLRLTAIVPSEWTVDCVKDKNNCSIGLRIDYCASSVLFTGDAENEEEAHLPLEAVVLLQAAHHGSDTSSSEEFLAKTRPRYAVISSGRPNEGMNAGYCHPRLRTVQRLSVELGPSTGKALEAFDGQVPCKGAPASNWSSVATSENLYSTARDGDVTLTTSGDGVFVIESESRGPPPS